MQTPLQLTFDIRAGLKYSDGTPLNAARYKYAITRNIDPDDRGRVRADHGRDQGRSRVAWLHGRR